MNRIILFFAAFIFGIALSAKAQDGVIRSAEGKIVLTRKSLFENCIMTMHKTKADADAVSVCNCQLNTIDGYFTNAQYRAHTHGRVIEIGKMVEEDSIMSGKIGQCYKNTGRSVLIQAESFGDEFITGCIKSLQENSEQKLDIKKLEAFCYCQLSLIKEKKISDEEMKSLSNPNSLFFFEIMYKCGDPFNTDSTDNSWSADGEKNITGPHSDTIKTLTINGLTYIKIKTGSMVQFWLFDTGASDMLIGNEMEKKLKEEGYIKESDYLGTGEYTMANGTVDTCRKYVISNLRLGDFSINNIVMAVSDKSKRIIAGRSLLNKFSNWLLDNKNNILILNREAGK